MRGVALLLGLLGMLTAWSASAAPSVYFLTVGSSRYLEPQAGSDHGFQKLDGARNGAVALGERFSEGGARFGISLSSPEGTVVGLADINRALDDILDRIRADKAVEPILIVYVAAHGISDGFAWNHFSIPGDLTYRGDPDKLPSDQLAEQALHAGILVDRLNKAHVHYLLILDTCYEGKASVFDSPVLSATATQNIGDIAKLLRFMNEFHQENPVLFSTTPGTTVPVAPDPIDPTSNSMGPLARRLVMLIDAKAPSGKPLSVSEIVAALQSPSTDSLTKPAVTNATPAHWWSGSLYIPGVMAGEVEERSGTAIVQRLCCIADSTAPMIEAVPVRGTVMLSGAAGEFVSDGKTMTLSKGITIQRRDATSMTINIPDPEGDWSLEFTVSKPFIVGSYENAVRAGFAEDGGAGLSVSGHGHGCNTVHGRFEITSFPAARHGALAMSFTQFCDDVVAPLTGTLRVQLP